MDTLAPRSGYELAAKILETHPNDAIETMLKYSNGAECDWLEFKAGMTLLPEDVRKGDKPDDLYWDYVLSIVAMANTRGGAFVIGVNDKTHKAVSLSSCDPRHVLENEGKEGYLRKEVLDRIDRRDRAWTTKDGTIWSLDESIAPHVEGRFVPFDGNDVLVLLVKPVDIGKELFVGQKIKNGDVFESLPFRHLGEAGKVKRLTKRADWENYSRTREITSGQFGTWWDELDAESAASKEQAKIEEAITEYYQRQTKKAQQLMAVFTPLDAEENVFNSDDAELFYSPEAIETIENDDWLDDDNDVGESESSDLEGSSGDGESDADSDDGYGEESDSESDDDDSEESESGAREARKGNLLELLNAEPRVIVSGEPGGGKTTCLTYYTLQHAKADGVDRILAVFIPMGQWKKGGSLDKMMSGVTGLDAAQLHHLIVENRLLLVIDAVNECPDVYRAAAIHDIGVFLARNPTVRAVISTRHPNELSELRLPVFHVQPMDEEHRRRYLAHYIGDENEAERLLRQIDTMPGGETIAENPMLLRLVVEVYRGSPTKRLPNGRAGLYRRSLHAWYKREKNKAENAGIQLHLNEHKTIEMLAKLAFRSRLAGYRDVPIEEVSTIWSENSDQQIAELCQGPIIYRDDEFLRFRHETFQEYLCAEYLVAHPSELPQWTEADYARWGMPFAYIVELFEQEQKPLPESFWMAAWELNPWLGVALTTKFQINGTLLACWKDTIYLKIIRGKLTTWTLRHILHDTPSLWYSRNDVALRYVVQVSQKCQEIWSEFERSQLSCLEGIWARQAMILSKNWLVLTNPREIFQYHAPDEWNGWIEEATIERAISLVDAGIALPSDFSVLIPQWKRNLTPQRAEKLIALKVLRQSDIEDIKDRWVNTVSPDTLLSVMKLGFLSFEDACRLQVLWGVNIIGRKLVKENFARVVQSLNLTPGRIVRGRIKNIVDFGVFIAIGCVDGLVRLSELCWAKHNALDTFHVGEEVQVKVIAIDIEKCKIELSIRQCQENPWDVIEESFPIGKRIKGRVTNIVSYGAFVEIAPGIEGLVHVSEFSWTQKITDARKILNVGDEVEVAILSVDADRQKVALSFRQCHENPWDSISIRYPVGSRVRGKVCNFTNNGARIGLEEGIDGMIHVSEMSWTRKINRPSECLQKGQVVEAVVLSIDSKKQQIALSLKQAQQDPRPDIFNKYKVGMVIKRKVSTIASFGAFIELEDGVDGLVHVSEISEGFAGKVKDVLQVGQEVEARVVKVDREAFRIGLSMRAVSMSDDEFNALEEELNSAEKKSADASETSSTHVPAD